MLSIIVAVAENNAIGKDNDLIWYISDDLKRFKRLTTGHTILMGRKTYESLPNGALPKRENVVITRDKDLKLDKCTMLHSVDEAIEKYAKSEEEVFVIGGGSIYEKLLPYAHKIFLTKVHSSFEADVFFPEIDIQNWKVIAEEHHEKGEKNEFNFSFIDLVKV
ncbi:MULTISPECIES: dihydrofolate reductase [unclassified Lentimicrobium]|uniref:dihydrofolate reductase n=1 Tax=unclassified Lentimicrobium TaxID=2677434 RepID=UPI001553891A|nr:MULTISPECIES: dihydrofolate reductase [unclassified Lentimicrobium]NPD43948.1 dihydrofolate reductase [Lentimicrobium sp. S6]NPD84163.1 dihydrofolate reductase [Lentimicrobium sp. L6]